MTEIQLNQIENMTNGSWHLCNQINTMGIIERAAQRDNQTVAKIESRLLAGETIYYMAAWDAKIRLAKEKPAPKLQSKPLRMCDCGHTTEYPMSTSNGSSCPDCYDRMSDC